MVYLYYISGLRYSRDIPFQNGIYLFYISCLRYSRDIPFFFLFFFFNCLVGCLSMIVWTSAVLGVLYPCVLYFCVCTCSAQLSMFQTRSRNTLIINIIVIDMPFWSGTLDLLSPEHSLDLDIQKQFSEEKKVLFETNGSGCKSLILSRPMTVTLNFTLGQHQKQPHTTCLTTSSL